jgi:hypothetical protein
MNRPACIPWLNLQARPERRWIGEGRQTCGQSQVGVPGPIQPDWQVASGGSTPKTWLQAATCRPTPRGTGT